MRSGLFFLILLIVISISVNSFIVFGGCQPPSCSICGNGIKEGSEICDEGNLNGFPGHCNLQCSGNVFGCNVCGNGIKECNEVCDEGNQNGQTGHCNLQCNGYVSNQVCGNGIKEGTEQCDDGNYDNNDNCISNCKLNVCGDGLKNRNTETCDEGNLNGQPGHCNNQCSGYSSNQVCGNGIKEGTEVCDEGNLNGQAGHCNTLCNGYTSNQVCGNGIKEGTEQCDDGNYDNNDNCISNCKLNVCGDGLKNRNTETCDEGNLNGQSGHCNKQCNGQVPVCGNGIKEGIEQCDDGNYDNNDNCISNCKLNVCGDGLKNKYTETCDEGNLNGQAGHCNLQCTGQVPVCGNGIKEGTEQCDDGNYDNNDNCVSNCKLNICGDGLKNRNTEICDEGNLNGQSGHCNKQCNGQVPVCGNGIKEGTEQCDDGNYDNNDNCISNCKLNVCGDGLKNRNTETCDEGNLNGQPGHCNKQCNGQVPTQTCGNSIKEGTEQCDLGNNNGIICGAPYGGQCNWCTKDCTTGMVIGPYCGDEVKNGQEACDDGNHNGEKGHCNSQCDGHIALCGNGVLESNEQCDLGNNNGIICGAPYGGQCNWCDLNCGAMITVGPFCGDGLINGLELCDDGNLNGAIGHCSAICSGFIPVPVCGNGVIEIGEACDEGPFNGAIGHCNLLCNGIVPQPVCGNGIPEFGELCDDGILNGQPGYCSLLCNGFIPFLCGNGITEPGEACDDGFNNGRIGFCSIDCRGIINCYENSDCGTNYWYSNPFCQGEDLYRTIYYYRCLDSGTLRSRCAEGIENVLFEDCSGQCTNNRCLEKKPLPSSDDLYIKDMWFGKVDRFVAKDQIDFTIIVQNKGKIKLEDLTVSVLIYDLGISRRVGHFDLSRNEEATKTMVLDIPYDVRPGIYDVRVTISGKSIKRIVNREVKLTFN